MRPSTLPVSALLLAGLPAVCAYAETGRSIALVLDASGSMNAKLPDGITRIDAAKSAVADLVGRLPGNVRLALRAYGHQSPTQQKDCRDTALLARFDTVANSKSAVIAAARGVRAQGYTPITYVLRLAAEDVGKEDAASRVVVLVSDGKETCAGDPCATAKALADADAKLVVHTVGLGVDAAARYQLKCIASVARGIYVDAGGAAELATALAKTAEVPARRVTEAAVPRTSGKIKIVGAPPASHAVVDASSGREVAKINTGYPSEVELPAGIYNIKFANGLWMGVEVTVGATTLLKPGFLKIEGHDLWGNKLLDPETQEVVGESRGAYDRVALVPTRVLVTFGNFHKLLWPQTVEITEGATTTLRPGAIQARSGKTFKVLIKGADGQAVGEISSAVHRVALPPARYTLELEGRSVPIELGEGHTVEVKID